MADRKQGGSSAAVHKPILIGLLNNEFFINCSSIEACL